MADPLLDLDETVRAAGIPIWGVAVQGNSFRVDYKPEATPQQRVQADALAASFDSSPIAAAVRQRAKQKALAKGAAEAGTTPDNRVIRAIAAELYNNDKAIADRVNGILSILTVAQKNAITANGFNSNSIPLRTMAEFIAAVQFRVDSDAS